MAGLKKILGGLGKVKQLLLASDEALPGVHYVDPLAPATMRMSEALGNAGAEGKTLNFTEADRSRVFGSNRGGVGFSGLQHDSLPHKDANTVWGFGNKTTAEKKIRQNDPENSLFTTFVGSPQQHKSNSVVIGDAIKEFQKSVKKGSVPREQIMLMNKRLNEITDANTGAKIFQGGFDLTDPSALNVANTFSRRAAVGDVMLGLGVKGPMSRVEFKKEFPDTKFTDGSNIENILKRETDPDLVDANTFDVGNRLFVLDGKIIERPDLNAAFPFQVTGDDLGMKFKLTPKEIAMRDFVKQYESPRGKTQQVRPPDYMDLSRNKPSQFVDEDYLTFLQKEGYKDGGSVDINAADARLAAAMQQRMAKGGAVDIEAADARLSAAMNRMAGGGLLKSAAKGVKRLFNDDVLPAAEREANKAKFLEPSKTPMRLYHGTTATEGGKGQEAIRRIKPSKEGALGSGVYLTPNQRYANMYGSGKSSVDLKEVDQSGNVLPVHAQIRNPLIIDGTHRDPMIEALTKLGMDEEKAARMVEKAYEEKGYIGKQVESRARAAGHDGLMQYRDGELSEVVSYNPNAVKSAIGNQGTYDVYSPDLSKAEGGPAFKTLQFKEPQNFDGGGIAVADDASTFEAKPNRVSDIKNNAVELYEEAKQQLSRLKNPEAARQYAKILAAQALGTVPDLAHLAIKYGNPLEMLPGAKLLKTGLTGTGVLDKPGYRSVLEQAGNQTSPRIKYAPPREPLGLAKVLENKNGDALFGVEDLIKRQQEAGKMYGNTVYARNNDDSFMLDDDGEKIQLYQTGRFPPLMEFAGSVAAGAGLSKLAKGATKAVEGFGKGFDKGYARAMSTPEPKSPLLNELGYDSTLDKQPVKLLGQQPQVMTALPGTPQGATYAIKQEGPFYRVSPTSLDVSGAKNRGIREAPELQGEGLDLRTTGQAGREVPQLLSPEEVGRIIADPVANQPLQIAQKFTKETQGTDFAKPDIPESSLAKQSAIGRAQQLAVEGSPEYKTAVFDAYAKQMPDLLEQVGAKNYDDLMEKAYRQLAKETDDQFKALPYNFSYHRAGEGNYNGAMDMASDVHGNKHLYVYQGGDPHDFLNRMDKASGLNENEKFRAVHDLLGHAIYGNQFGPKGEEIAWAVHQQMYSPLARLAMTAETRGQNSMVNYSPLNVKVKSAIAKLDELEVQALRKGDKALVNEIRAAKRQEYAGFEFAPNKAVLLPPEFIDPKFSGGLPDYLSAANKPAKGTESQSALTHFSNSPELQFLDPKRYGTGIKGAEAKRLNEYEGGVKDRSYVYLGEPGTVAPEPGLGVNRYRGESQNLYDITKDPLNFRALARESNRTPFTAKYNAGITSPLQEANDYERLVKEYGYEGMINPNASKPMGIMFKPTPVQPRKRGGLTQSRVR